VWAGGVYAQRAPAIKVVTENAGSTIILRWPIGLMIEHKFDSPELFFSFSRPIENEKVAEIPAHLSSMIEDVQYGYDTLLLRLRVGIEPKVNVLADGIRIELSRRPPYTPEERAQLDYLRALALYNDGQRRESRKLLKELASRNSESAEATELLMQIEDELGRGPVALSLAEGLVKNDPNPVWVRQQRQYLRRAYGDQLRIDTLWWNAEEAETQFISRLSGRYSIKPDLSWSGLAENRKVEIDQIQSVNGDITDFNGNRQRLQLELRKDWERPQTTQFLLFAKSGKRKLGAGIRHTFGLDLGRPTVSLIMNEPYWDLVEGIVGSGSRNRAAIDFATQSIPRMYTALGASVDSYGVGSDANVASGIGYTASLQYYLREDMPFIGADYYLIGRHINDIDEKTNNDGDLFNPLPIVSVEIHYLGLSISDELIGSRLRYTVAGGYALDRLGGNGPVADLSLAYEMTDSLEVGLQSNTYPLLERGQMDFQFSIGGYLTTRF
jgi:hypothetical protein